MGAGDHADHSTAYFSTYGSRVDLQGWGDWSVTTTGYGDLYSSGSDANTYYTSGFSGTSSASPIVAGAAADLESVFKAVSGSAAWPSWIRQRLVDTGTPQSDPHHIGPQPDLLHAETNKITVYSIALQFKGLDPGSQPDLNGYIYNNYKNQASRTTYIFQALLETQVTFSFSSNPSGWSFANWWDDYGMTGQSNTQTLTINVGTTNHKVAAFFSRIQYTVTFYTDPTSGTITADGSSKSDGATGTYSSGQHVHVIANPPTGYSFSYWETSGVSVDNQNPWTPT